MVRPATGEKCSRAFFPLFDTRDSRQPGFHQRSRWLASWFADFFVRIPNKKILKIGFAFFFSLEALCEMVNEKPCAKWLIYNGPSVLSGGGSGFSSQATLVQGYSTASSRNW